MINFNFGKKKPDKKQIIIVSIVLSSIIAALSQCTGVSENKFWDLLDEIQRKYFPESIVGEIIRQDPSKIERRVKRDVDKAIEEYKNLTENKGNVKIPSPLYSEINGVMRLCSLWVDDCIGTPLEVYQENKIEFNQVKKESDKIKFFKF